MLHDNELSLRHLFKTLEGTTCTGLLGYSRMRNENWHIDQNAEWEKHYVFSTFETVSCTEVD